ncbi:methyltransferase domain-containing protein [Candidatus Peregrinibacteria bacterium]|nr:MAG: methyltransferase domain-containing protein [Candidatus Peregrinibacteria bacterium]
MRIDIFFALLTAILLFFLFVRGGLSIAPWVPTRKRDIERIHRMAKLQKREVFIDLGCGDGRVAREIALRNPDAIIIGMEISLFLFAYAYWKNVVFPLPNLSFQRGDIFQKDLTKGDVFYLFGRRESAGDIEEYFQKTKGRGKRQRLLSYHFPLPKTTYVRKDKGITEQATIYEYLLG